MFMPPKPVMVWSSVARLTLMSPSVGDPVFVSGTQGGSGTGGSMAGGFMAGGFIAGGVTGGSGMTSGTSPTPSPVVGALTGGGSVVGAGAGVSPPVSGCTAPAPRNTRGGGSPSLAPQSLSRTSAPRESACAARSESREESKRFHARWVCLIGWTSFVGARASCSGAAQLRAANESKDRGALKQCASRARGRFPQADANPNFQLTQAEAQLLPIGSAIAEVRLFFQSRVVRAHGGKRCSTSEQRVEHAGVGRLLCVAVVEQQRQ